uniref:Uncharacterized protein n=1 Tax=Glossina brevipalpis TaxID=37001 RepID=A0A1A9W9V0_9MUSC
MQSQKKFFSQQRSYFSSVLWKEMVEYKKRNGRRRVTSKAKKCSELYGVCISLSIPYVRTGIVSSSDMRSSLLVLVIQNKNFIFFVAIATVTHYCTWTNSRLPPLAY